MNLSNVHTFEKNKAYFKELLVIHECQGNFERYFIALVGHPDNVYTFVLKDIKTQEIFKIETREKDVFEWKIREGCNGSQGGRKYKSESIDFYAVGILAGTRSKYVLLESSNSQVIKGFFKDEMKEFQFIDINVTNKCNIDAISRHLSNFNNDEKLIKHDSSSGWFTGHYLRNIRGESLNNTCIANDLKERSYKCMSNDTSYCPDSESEESDSEEEHY